MSNQRIEQDSLGELLLGDVYYGIHTLRAARNFDFSAERTSLALIYAMVTIKKAAAKSHRQLKSYDPSLAFFTETRGRIRFAPIRLEPQGARVRGSLAVRQDTIHGRLADHDGSDVLRLRIGDPTRSLASL